MSLVLAGFLCGASVAGAAEPGVGAAGGVAGGGQSPPPQETAPVAHITTDPLLPQAYRVVAPGVYPCEVDIHVRADGFVTDVTPVRCDDGALLALATAIVAWEFDPATRDGVKVDGVLRYATSFEVRSALPRKHLVGFVGVGASVGGAGLVGVEARAHMGETLSATLGVDRDQDIEEGTGRALATNVLRGDIAFSSRRRHFEKRAIYGLALGAFLDDVGANGAYAAMRFERMAGPPGLAFGADAGMSVLFNDPPTVDDIGPVTLGSVPFAPWVRGSLVWYAPLPRDRFVVIPREQDPTVFEPVPPAEEAAPDVDGSAFDGFAAIHWSEIEPSLGAAPEGGDAFSGWPPGTYPCNVRAAIDAAGRAVQVRAEQCPSVGRSEAEATVRGWEWPAREGGATVQAVFPAPFFVAQESATQVRAQVTNVLADGVAKPLPPRAGRPPVWAKASVTPEWGSTRPTRACFVDVDLDARGGLLRTKWVSGDIEVRPRVEEALAGWQFYPVIVGGEATPVRARLVMCED